MIDIFPYSSVQLHLCFFVFHVVVFSYVACLLKKQNKTPLIMEISNILKSKADRMIMSPHVPITPASAIRKRFFPVQSLFPCVCVSVCTHTYAYIFFLVYAVWWFAFHVFKSNFV